MEANDSRLASFGRLRQPKDHSLVQLGDCAICSLCVQPLIIRASDLSSHWLSAQSGMASNEAMTLKVNGAAATSQPAHVLLNRQAQ